MIPVGCILHPSRSPSNSHENSPRFQRHPVRSDLYLTMVSCPILPRSLYRTGADIMCSVGTCLGFAFNFVQDRLYKRHVGKHGVEARLYGAMAAGPGLAVGCIIFGLTAIPSVHWIAPCVGLVIILSKFTPEAVLARNPRSVNVSAS
jgi:hypothetical protein